MRLWLFIFVGFLGLINVEIVGSRRVFGSTHSVIFPKFYPNPNKINHKFLPKYEYTVFYERTTLPPTNTVFPLTTSTTTPTTTTSTTTTTPSPNTTIRTIATTPSTSTTSTTTSFPKPLIHDIPSTTTTVTAISATTTDTTVAPPSDDSNFSWFGVLIVLLITLLAVAFFVIRRKCSSPSGTYKIPKTNLVPKEYYVNFSRVDDEFIEIRASALYGPGYVTSIENQNFDGADSL